MVIIDIFVIILLLACISYGAFDGFIKIFFGFASIILGSLIAGQFYIYGSNFLPQNDWTLLFSFAIIFFVVSSLTLLFGKFMGSIFEKMLLKPVDKILGALFTLFLGTLVIGIIYSSLADISPQTLSRTNAKNGKVVQFIVKFDEKLFKTLPKYFQKKLKNISPKKVEKKLTKKVEKFSN